MRRFALEFTPILALALVIGMTISVQFAGALSQNPLVAPAYGNSLVAEIKDQEGFRGLPYADTRGYSSIAYGTKLPLTRAEGETLLRHRLGEEQTCVVGKWPAWDDANDRVREVLSMMAYQLGCEGLVGDPLLVASGDCDRPKAARPRECGFHDMLAALERGDYAAARAAALDSDLGAGDAGQGATGC